MGRAGAQLALLPLVHDTAVYQLDKLWGITATDAAGIAWYSWRCTCGRDPGAERRAAFSHPAGAEQMAAHHRHDWAPWNA